MPLDINVSLREYRHHTGILRGQIQLLCSGKDMNDQLLNAIGRIATKRVPTYAFAKELINIERINPETGYHDSVPFNHDMMRNRLENIPVMNIDPEISYLHEKYWQVDYLDKNRERHEKEKNIEAYIDIKNTDDEVKGGYIRVTTNDMKVYVDGKITELYDKEYPLLLIELRPKEAFKCSMTAVLGVGLRNSCWDACSNFYYDQETIEGKTILVLEASSRFDEFTLVERALEYFIIRTEKLKDEIKRLYLLEEEKTKKFEIVLKNEDHTIAEAINYEIQSHNDILVSSVKKPDLLVNNIVISIVAIDKNKLLEAIMSSIDNLIEKIHQFQLEFRKISKTKKHTKAIIKDKSKTKSKTKAKSKIKTKAKSKTKARTKKIIKKK
jgi:DNA-directed RNA polymerase subunit L